ncbi:uncharacterized protein [Centruroides vittatus]|uniref:uncharacterized protein n=1 Tax=Centruroides vittatus TaxID=120091 RepID=UPI00351033FD
MGLFPREIPTRIEGFMDGSKTAEGTASAFVIFGASGEIHNQTFELHPECSVFQAEIFAVLMAIKWCNVNLVNMLVNIYTDSAATVTKLRNKDTTNPISIDIFAEVATSSNSYAINWIKRHQGTPGNERADYLARNATLNHTNHQDYDRIPKSKLKSLVWNEAIKAWQADWDKISCQHVTKRFFPSIQNHMQNKWMQPSHELTQFLTEHGRFRVYLKRLK